MSLIAKSSPPSTNSIKHPHQALKVRGKSTFPSSLSTISPPTAPCRVWANYIPQPHSEIVGPASAGFCPVTGGIESPDEPLFFGKMF